MIDFIDNGEAEFEQELDDLKKSWNALDEHLKSKEFIEEKEIASVFLKKQEKKDGSQ